MTAIQLDTIRIHAKGSVCPPGDMIEAARLSLSEAGFNNLMHQLGRQAPTPAQLCAAVEQERITAFEASPQYIAVKRRMEAAMRENAADYARRNAAAD